MSKREGLNNVVLVGNPGSGKSFLCNVLLREVHFASRFSAEPVTRHPSCRITTRSDKTTWELWDMPGVTQPQKRNACYNRQMISVCMHRDTRSIAVFVVRPNNGRLLKEDTDLFSELIASGTIKASATVIVINGQPDLLEPVVLPPSGGFRHILAVPELDPLIDFATDTQIAKCSDLLHALLLSSSNLD